MGDLNVIFQSQTIPNSDSLFYTAEKWPKLEEKKETEDTNPYIPKFIPFLNEGKPHPVTTYD